MQPERYAEIPLCFSLPDVEYYVGLETSPIFCDFMYCFYFFLFFFCVILVSDLCICFVFPLFSLLVFAFHFVLCVFVVVSLLTVFLFFVVNLCFRFICLLFDSYFFLE